MIIVFVPEVMDATPVVTGERREKARSVNL
jgi:hypothetical protein